ncbi:MAG: hypothetical protein NC910_03470 [Candidatus Omnitrophica bacterium]|nr:hypothetical protein [Candidatus Omnitrophota bacterium]
MEQTELAETQTRINWQDYLAIIVRRRWFFLVPCLSIFLGSMVMGLFMPKIYRAETAILVQEPNIMNPLISGLAISSSVRSRLGLLREEILSWTSLSRLVEDLKLDKGITNPVAFEGLVRGLQNNIRVGMRGGEILMIAYEHEDPRMAQQVVNSISGIFMERNTAAQSAETDTAIDFIGKEMDVYKKELEESERRLREFKEMNAADLPVADELNRQVIQLETQLAELLVENTEIHPAVVATKRRLEELKRRRNQEIRKFVANSIAKGQDPQLYQDLLTVLEVPAQEKELKGIDQEKVKLAKEAYGALVERMEKPVPVSQRPGAPAGAQVQVITRADDPAMGGSVEVFGGGPTSVALSPWQEQKLAQLTRDYQVHAGTYQHLQERMQRAKITRRLGESDEGLRFRILEPARLPLRPVRPNMFKLGLFGLFLGIFVGAGVVFLVEFLDQSFQSTDELQAALALPVLGSISTILTEEDLEAQRERIKHWLALKRHVVTAFKTVRNGVAQQVDRFLVRWKV